MVVWHGEFIKCYQSFPVKWLSFCDVSFIAVRGVCTGAECLCVCAEWKARGRESCWTTLAWGVSVICPVLQDALSTGSVCDASLSTRYSVHGGLIWASSRLKWPAEGSFLTCLEGRVSCWTLTCRFYGYLVNSSSSAGSGKVQISPVRIPWKSLANRKGIIDIPIHQRARRHRSWSLIIRDCRPARAHSWEHGSWSCQSLCVERCSIETHLLAPGLLRFLFENDILYVWCPLCITLLGQPDFFLWFIWHLDFINTVNFLPSCFIVDVIPSLHLKMSIVCLNPCNLIFVLPYLLIMSFSLPLSFP